MVQTASFAVLTAIAFGAVSVAAIPVFPESVPQSAQRPMQMASAGRRPASFGPGPQRLENQPRPSGARAQRPENPTRPEGGRPADNMLKSQTQALDRMKATDARLDRQKAQGFEAKYKADQAEFKAYENEAQSLEPSRRPQSKVAPRALPIKQSTPPPARPAVAAARPNTQGRPVTNGAARVNPRPSEQQQLSSQRTALNNEKQKFANQDMAEYKKYEAEANAYHSEAERLEPQRKTTQAKPQTYQQSIASQNSGLQAMENKFKQEDKQYGAPGPRDLEDEADYFARLDEEEQYAREWDEYDLRAVEAPADMAEGAEAAAAAPLTPAPMEHHKKKGGKKGGKHGKKMHKMAERDFEDDVEEFAREWDEYELRAEPNVPAPATDIAEAPAAPSDESSDASIVEPASNHHHGKKKGGKKGGKKGHSKKPRQVASRDLEDEAEAFAREWEEFVTREWAALEELD